MVMDVAVSMVCIFGAMCAALYGLSTKLTKISPSGGSWFQTTNLAKKEFEIWALYYTCVWIGLFGCVVVFKFYEWCDEWGYMLICVPLDLPFLLQPILFPLPAEKHLPLFQRYSFKANVWLAIFSFIGSYWYTHYFYTVLGARYLFSSHRLNDVPIALYFAAHFYFVTYHTASTLILRKIETTYAPGTMRTIFFWSSIVVFSYFTAFMETLSISSFPDYAFEDRNMAYTLGV